MNASTRTKLYTTSILVSAVGVVVILATLLTMGVLTTDTMEAWVKNLMYAVAGVGQIVAIIAAYVAKNHVTPDLPIEEALLQGPPTE